MVTMAQALVYTLSGIALLGVVTGAFFIHLFFEGEKYMGLRILVGKLVLLSMPVVGFGALSVIALLNVFGF